MRRSLTAAKVLVFVCVILAAFLFTKEASADTYMYYPSGNLWIWMLSIPEPDGTFYYEYIDEDFYGDQTGRVKWRYIDDGTKVEYSYFTGTDLPNEISYYDSTWECYEIHTFYISGNMATKWILTPLPDGTNLLEYLDEDWYGGNLGRVSATTLETANPDGEISFEYTYHSGTDLIQYKDSYTDESRTQSYARYEYDLAGNLIKIINYVTGETYTYYISGLLESKTLSAPDVYGGLYYHYMDEDFEGRGYGRLNYQVLAAPDADGAIAYYFVYHAGTEDLLYKYCYLSADYSDPSAPVMSGLRIVYQYDPAGALTDKFTYYTDTGFMESWTMAEPDGMGNVYYHYINEDFFGGYGRTDYHIFQDPDSDGAMGFEYTYYGATTDIQFKYCYRIADYADPSNPLMSSLLVTYLYYNSGNMWMRILENPDPDGVIRFDFMDEDFYGGGVGRLKWRYFDDGSQIENSYFTGTDTLSEISYYDSAWELYRKETFYMSTRLESKTILASEADPAVYYHYIDEDFYGDLGRVDIQVLDAVGPLGEIAYTFEYYPGTDSCLLYTSDAADE